MSHNQTTKPMKRIFSKSTYIFFTETKEGVRTIIKTQTCKRPSQTKVYKDLEKQGFSNEVFKYGYEQTLEPKEVSPYKHVFFRLKQNIYEWGKGWLISDSMANSWEIEIVKLLNALNLLPVKSQYGKVYEGFNESGESLYMHPMDFTGYIHKDNIKAFETKIKEFSEKSRYWEYAKTDVFELETEVNRFGYVGNIERNKENYKKHLVVSN